MKKTTALLVFVFMTVLFLAGCYGSKQPDAAEQPTEQPTEEAPEKHIEFTTEHLRIIEPEAFGPVINDNMHKTELEGVVYWVPKDLPEGEELVKKQAELMAFLGGKGFETAGATVYIIKNGSVYSESDNTAAHMDPESVGTAAAIRATLGALMGDYTNAGYLYALAESIAAEMGAEPTAAAEPNVKVFQNYPVLLNLTAPCFMEEYNAAFKVEACRALAVKLLEKMDDPYSGEAGFLGLLKEYAGENGIEFTPTAVKYAYNGKTCPVKILTSDLKINISTDYVRVTPLDYPNSTYDPLFDADRMMLWFDEVDSFTIRLRELFGIDTWGHLDVSFTDTYANGAETGGVFYYYGTKRCIYAREFDSLKHEYVHYLYSIANEGEYGDTWRNEVLAYWYGREDEYEYYEYKASLNGAYREYWEAVIGEEYDSIEDYDKFSDITAAMIMLNDGRNGLRFSLMKDLGGGRAKQSFAGYFIKAYGEETFIACMLDPSKSEELIGKSPEEAVEDWMDALPELTEEQLELLLG